MTTFLPEHKSVSHARGIRERIHRPVHQGCQRRRTWYQTPEAARLMASLDVGALPVGENDRLVGMITDRDIVVRALAQGHGPDTPIRDVMSPEIRYCYEDQAVEDVARNMGDIQVRRLPVLNRDKRLVGIVSLGDIATGKEHPQHSGEALSNVSRRGGPHSQTESRSDASASGRAPF